MSEKEFDDIMRTFESAHQARTTKGIESTLKSHGKCFGMDAFSWHNPNVSVLEKTIGSFPFSTIWIGNEAEIKEFIASDESNYTKIEQYIVYGDSDEAASRKKITHVRQLSEALQSMPFFTSVPGILIFTASDADSPFSMGKFEEFISSHQQSK